MHVVPGRYVSYCVGSGEHASDQGSPDQSLIPLVPLSGGNYPDYSNPEVVAFERYRIDKELGKDVHPASIAD